MYCYVYVKNIAYTHCMHITYCTHLWYTTIYTSNILCIYYTHTVHTSYALYTYTHCTHIIHTVHTCHTYQTYIEFTKTIHISHMFPYINHTHIHMVWTHRYIFMLLLECSSFDTITLKLPALIPTVIPFIRVHSGLPFQNFHGKMKILLKKPYGSVWYLKTTKPKFRYTPGQGTEQVTPGIFWNMDSWMFHVLQKVASRQQQKVKLEQEYLTSRVTSTSMQFPEREPWSTAFFGICDAHRSHVNTLYDFWQNSLIWRT